eukprot:1614157-Pyramimonas_sp.AAC.1
MPPSSLPGAEDFPPPVALRCLKEGRAQVGCLPLPDILRDFAPHPVRPVVAAPLATAAKRKLQLDRGGETVKKRPAAAAAAKRPAAAGAHDLPA